MNEVLKKKKSEMPQPASYCCKGSFYGTSYEAEKAAIKESLASLKGDAVIVLNEHGSVELTVCKINDGIAVVHADGGVEKYKSVMSVYSEDGTKFATVAIVSGRITQL